MASPHWCESYKDTSTDTHARLSISNDGILLVRGQSKNKNLLDSQLLLV